MPKQKLPQQIEIANHIPAGALSTLLRVSSALAASLDLAIVLQTAIQSACEVLDLETGAIYQLEGGSLRLGATTPPLPAALNWMKARPEPLAGHPHIQSALAQRRPVFVADAQAEPLSPAEAAVRDARALRSILYIPLLMEDEPLGVMIVGTTGGVRHLTAEETDLCRVLAYQVALAVTNARLFQSVHESNVELTHAYDTTLLGWSLALEMRDQETQGHTRRVTRMTVDLARTMGVPEDHLEHIRRGALLHDIGKMSIPDAILKKAGPLTADEWAVMRLHPGYAYQFLLNIAYLAPALDIPYCHHEKWDGAGYPRGLSGESIPLAARIFAVVDVFDALTSDRPYRKAWDREAATAYIREQAGKHFDPRVAKAFLAQLSDADISVHFP